MSKPVIGVTPLWDAEKSSLWMLPGYMDGIERAGGLPVMLPLTTDKGLIGQVCQVIDGLLFTGGQDISPSLYGEEKSDLCKPACEERDIMESLLFSMAVMGMDMPAFGICRGIQLFNALLGGTLYQDLPAECRGRAPVCHQKHPPYSEASHHINIEPGSPLHTILGADVIPVNSYHHQGIRDLSNKLTCMAVSEDGLAEAVRIHGRRFAWAVQWHPEISLHDENNRKLFEVFVKASIQARRG